MLLFENGVEEKQCFVDRHLFKIIGCVSAKAVLPA